MEKTNCIRNTVKIVYEATIVVDVDLAPGTHCSIDEIYDLARHKALMCNKNEFRIGDEINQDIVCKTEVIATPMNDLLEFLSTNRNDEDDDDDDEDEGDDEIGYDGM